MRKLCELSETHQKFLESMPNVFTRKHAAEMCLVLGLKERWFDTSLRKKNFATLFIKQNHGVYRKK